MGAKWCLTRDAQAWTYSVLLQKKKGGSFGRYVPVANVVRGGGGFTDCEILENVWFPPPFEKILAVDTGEVGMGNGGGPSDCDVPNEDKTDG